MRCLHCGQRQSLSNLFSSTLKKKAINQLIEISKQNFKDHRINQISKSFMYLLNQYQGYFVMKFRSISFTSKRVKVSFHCAILVLFINAFWICLMVRKLLEEGVVQSWTAHQCNCWAICFVLLEHIPVSSIFCLSARLDREEK